MKYKRKSINRFASNQINT